MRDELELSGARLVLPDRVMFGGVRVVAGVIEAVVEGELAGGIDLGGDFLIPGIVDLHTDNLERQVQPRVKARWPSRSAYLAHDAQCAAAGVTTVLDALCVGDLGYEQGRVRTFRDGIADGAALAAAGLLKAEHFLHLRCELPAPDMWEMFCLAVGDPALRMVSLMDHTPGYGQYGKVDGFRHLRRVDGLDEPAIDALIARQHALRAEFRDANRGAVLAALAGRGVAIASHDDRLADEVREHHALGVGLSEFPVSFEAAATARELGMGVIAGAPNLVRGGSHSGNVAVAALLGAGLVDALASDYVPSSLIEAAFGDPAAVVEGVARVTAAPAAMVGLGDRGRIAVGLLGDLVQVHVPAEMPTLPVIRRVWRGGARIA